MLPIFFFFSSRRRHTRWTGDWSSDVCSSDLQAIVMIEAGAIEVSEDQVAEALQFGHDQIKHIIAAIRELHDKIKPNKVTVPALPFDETLAKEIEQKYGAQLHDALDTKKYPKK